MDVQSAMIMSKYLHKIREFTTTEMTNDSNSGGGGNSNAGGNSGSIGNGNGNGNNSIHGYGDNSRHHVTGDKVKHLGKDKAKKKKEIFQALLEEQDLPAYMAAVTKELDIKCLILDYPPLDIYTDVYLKPRPKGSLPPKMCRIFDACYCSNKEEGKNPLISTVFATIDQVKSFPPTLILTASMDSLCKEAEDY